MKQKKERAALAPHEEKIASLSTILAEIHRIRLHARTAATKNPSPLCHTTRQTAERKTERPVPWFHPFCKSQTPARSTATLRRIDYHNNRRSSPASRRSPSSITTLPASRARAGKLRWLFSAYPRKTEIQPVGRNLQAVLLLSRFRTQAQSLVSAHSCQRSLPANIGSESETGNVLISEKIPSNNSRALSALNGYGGGFFSWP